jgi:hypothetical protein
MPDEDELPDDRRRVLRLVRPEYRRFNEQASDGVKNTLEDLRKRFEDGRRFALIEAVGACARADLPLPQWAAEAFGRGLRAIEDFEIGSLDDAFGRPHPKGMHLGRARLKKWNRMLVFDIIRDFRREYPEVPLGDELFEIVGRHLGVGGSTLVSELYYDMKRERDELVAEVKADAAAKRGEFPPTF